MVGAAWLARSTAALVASLLATPAAADPGPATHATPVAGPCTHCLSALPDGGAPAPLLVLLHGDGENAGTMFTAWAPAAEAKGIAVLAIDCPRSEGCTRASFWRWNGNPSWIVEQTQALAERRPIDASRMWIVGWSGGASYIGWKTQALEKTFAAIVIHGGGIPPEDATCPSRRASVYFLVGDDNPLHSLAEQLRDHYADCQQDVTWTLLRGADHPAEWRALGARRESILSWLSTKRLALAAPPSPPSPSSVSGPDASLPASTDANVAAAPAASSEDASLPALLLPPATTTSRRSAPPASCRCTGAGVGSASPRSAGAGVPVGLLVVVAATRRRRSRRLRACLPVGLRR